MEEIEESLANRSEFSEAIAIAAAWKSTRVQRTVEIDTDQRAIRRAKIEEDSPAALPSTRAIGEDVQHVWIRRRRRLRERRRGGLRPTATARRTGITGLANPLTTIPHVPGVIVVDDQTKHVEEDTPARRKGRRSGRRYTQDHGVREEGRGAGYLRCRTNRDFGGLVRGCTEANLEQEGLIS